MAASDEVVYLTPSEIVPRGKAPGARAQLLSDNGGRKTYALVLASGDEVATALMDFVKAHQVQAAHFTAIGALRDVKVAWYDLERKAYKVMPIPGQVEALSVVGDVGMAGGQPAVHCHITVGLDDASARGGHLVQAVVSPTLEIMLTVEPTMLKKMFDSCTGLTLFDPAPQSPQSPQ
ncbi:MAG TPA: PPC domain-containing DNA-binding protein [Pseudorhodoferax sp.]|nr:PPC domain-containing DNA-binding protein [Pseudorhodoferax sp.]